MGAEAVQRSQPAATRSAFEYQTLIALMLSSQTKDPMVAKAVSRLRSGLGKHGLSVEGTVTALHSFSQRPQTLPKKFTAIIIAPVKHAGRV